MKLCCVVDPDFATVLDELNVRSTCWPLYDDALWRVLCCAVLCGLCNHRVYQYVTAITGMGQYGLWSGVGVILRVWRQNMDEMRKLRFLLLSDGR